MARKRSEFLRGFGKAFEIFKALTDAVLERGGDDSNVERILTSKILRAKLADLITEFQNSVFAVWKTVKLGTGLETADEFCKALKQSGCRITYSANDILGRSEFSARNAELDLVVVSVADLGFKDGAYRQDFYKNAQELGLELCPAEVGPQLRLQYHDQPKGEWLLVGMEPISDSDDDLMVFRVGRDDDGLWLDGDFGYPRPFWFADSRWVFVLPRK